MIAVPKFIAGDHVRKIADHSQGRGLVKEVKLLEEYEVYSYSILWETFDFTMGYAPEQLHDEYEVDVDYKEYPELFLDIEDMDYVWRVPLSLVARNYALHFMKLNGGTFYEYYDRIMTQHWLAETWYENFMDWEDVSLFAKLIQSPPKKTQSGNGARARVIKKV